MARLAVFASGTGTNFAALADALVDTEHETAYLVCNVPRAGVVSKAEARKIPVHVVEYCGRRRAEAEEQIERILTENPVDMIALAGFMKILSPQFVDRHTIVNIHPSLLPKHPGTNAIERSWHSGDPELGVTVHLVDHGVDTGPILAQESFDRRAVGNLDEAEARIHDLEHELYPRVVLGLLDRAGGGGT
jgi:phosphoribosylglycinamide formyltransferase-1